MKRTLGIILIIAGVIFTILALTHFEKDRTLVDLGKIEIKIQDQSPSNNTILYFVIAAVCIIAGGTIVAGKKQ